MAYSDKELVARARRRVATMEKYGVENDALKNFRQDIEKFYRDFNVKKTSKSGISLTKQMSTEERGYMRQFIRNFMSEESGVTQIEREYDKMFSYYEDSVMSGTIRKASTIQEKARSLDYLRDVLTNKFLSKHYDSDVLAAIYHERAESQEEYENYKVAMLEVIKDDVATELDNDKNQSTYDTITGKNDIISFRGQSLQENDFLINRITVKYNELFE